MKRKSESPPASKRANGAPAPAAAQEQPHTVQITIRLDPSLLSRLDAAVPLLSPHLGRAATRADVMRVALVHYVEEGEEKELTKRAARKTVPIERHDRRSR